MPTKKVGFSLHSVLITTNSPFSFSSDKAGYFPKREVRFISKINKRPITMELYIFIQLKYNKYEHNEKWPIFVRLLMSSLACTTTSP